MQYFNFSKTVWNIWNFLPFITKRNRCQLNKTVTMQNIDLPKTAVGLKINTTVILWSTFPTDRQTITEMLVYSKIIFKLDSLCWFSQRRSPMPYFCGVRTQGAMTSTFKLSRDFCTMHLPSSFTIILCLLVRKLSCWQTNTHTHTQTNRRRWKHPALFATLRRWVIKLFSDIKFTVTHTSM